MDEFIRLRATTDGHLDVSALSPRFALRWCSLAAVWLRGSRGVAESLPRHAVAHMGVRGGLLEPQ